MRSAIILGLQQADFRPAVQHDARSRRRASSYSNEENLLVFKIYEEAKQAERIILSFKTKKLAY